MPDTFSPPVSPTSGLEFATGDAARATQIEAVRQSLIILGKTRIIPLGGVFYPAVARTADSYIDVYTPFDIPLCADDYAGFDVDVLCWLLSPDGVTLARMRLVDLDNASSSIGESTTSASSTPARQAVTITLPAGSTPHFCRPQIKSNVDTGAGVAGWMALRIQPS